MWITFLGPEPHPWAKDGSANHQELLLRIFWDGSDRPGVEAPLGDFFAGCFGKRSEVISTAVIVEGGDSYNRRLLQLLLAHAIPQVGAGRNRERER
jgi:hypothetical protein